MQSIKMLFVITGTFILSAFIFTACNGGNNNKDAEKMPQMNKDSGMKSSEAVDTSMAVITPTFTHLDPKVSASVKGVVDDYLVLKNALAADNSSAAADAGKAMAEALGKVDKSAFTADQKKLYDENEGELKEHAEHIGRNGGNIEHQREHFSMMSEDVHALVKAFGGGQTLYNDHCPMYKDKGAMWVSEALEIKNPYLGGKMPTCGEVKEKIK